MRFLRCVMSGESSNKIGKNTLINNCVLTRKTPSKESGFNPNFPVSHIQLVN